MTPTVTIVVPIHNEASYLPDALARLIEEVRAAGVSFELILAENGSTDDTTRIARDLAGAHHEVRVLELPRPDYGAAMRAGFRSATGAWVVNFDIDYFSGTFLSEALALEDVADLVLASKRLPSSQDRRSPMRRVGTLVFNLLLRILFRSRVSDTHGMKMVRAEVVDAVVPLVVSTKDLFDTELVVRAERAGYRIKEIPAVVEEQRDARSSFLSRVPRTVIGLLKIRWNLWRDR
jgi:glycosyltransferase involved in cell wall biosynthesis